MRKMAPKYHPILSNNTNKYPNSFILIRSKEANLIKKKKKKKIRTENRENQSTIRKSLTSSKIFNWSKQIAGEGK